MPAAPLPATAANVGSDFDDSLSGTTDSFRENLQSKDSISPPPAWKRPIGSTVTNNSEAEAHNVIARCPIPRGCEFVKALPDSKGDDKVLEWHLETLEPNASREIEVVFQPNLDATEIAVIGKVQFEHGRVLKTKLANPKLEMKKTGPAQGVLDEPLHYKIVVTNPGKVPVSDLQIVDTLPDGLQYVRETSSDAIPVSKIGPAANQRTWTLGTIRPNESRTIEYRVMAGKTGNWASEAVATAAGVHEKAELNTVVHEARISLSGRRARQPERRRQPADALFDPRS